MKKLTSKKLLSDARSTIEFIKFTDALSLINDSAVLFVDVRDKEEIKTGIIASSLHAPRGMLEFLLDVDCEFHLSEFSSGKTFIFVCGSGGRATLATKLANDFGLNAKCLTGGMKEWKAGNGPLE